LRSEKKGRGGAGEKRSEMVKEKGPERAFQAGQNRCTGSPGGSAVKSKRKEPFQSTDRGTKSDGELRAGAGKYQEG